MQFKSLITTLSLVLLGIHLLGQVSTQKINEARNFAIEHGLDTDLFVFIDMSVHSGKNRFFVYNQQKKTITHNGLCSHGCCNSPWGEDLSKTSPTFSNEHESHCSSLGKYKIGKRGNSNWGIHVNYKLHGLESSNSNAYDRLIVLHSWNDVPNSETYPDGTPEGWGCPAISNDLMKQVDSLLTLQSKPVLLWIYQ